MSDDVEKPEKPVKAKAKPEPVDTGYRVQITRDSGSGAVHNGRGQKFQRGDTVRIPDDVDDEVARQWIANHHAEKFGS